MDHWFVDDISHQSQSEKLKRYLGHHQSQSEKQNVTMATNESTLPCTFGKYKQLSYTWQTRNAHLGCYVVHERPSWQRHWASPQLAGRGLGKVHHDVRDAVVGVTDEMHHLRHSVHLHLSRSHLVRLLVAKRGRKNNAQ